jgi:hypothetical protein
MSDLSRVVAVVLLFTLYRTRSDEMALPINASQTVANQNRNDVYLIIRIPVVIQHFFMTLFTAQSRNASMLHLVVNNIPLVIQTFFYICEFHVMFDKRYTYSMFDRSWNCWQWLAIEVTLIPSLIGITVVGNGWR